MPFYAVARGKNTGVFKTWPECQAQIVGFKGAVFKKFESKEDAETFVTERKGHTIDKRKPPTQTSADDANDRTTNEGSLSPTLMRMKKEMKDLQKQLSSLRDRFEDYIGYKSVSEGDSASKSSKRKADKNDEGSSKKIKTVEVSNDKGEKMKFEEDSDGFLVVFTDGACSFNGRHGAQAGIGVYFGPDNSLNLSEPVKGRATNNTAEIQAAMHALRLSRSAGFDKVIVNTDSQFMISCMTSWMPGWKKRDWKKKDGKEVINKEDLILLDKASDGLLVKWNHVNGHSGIPGNEAADKLARDGAKRYKAENA